MVHTKHTNQAQNSSSNKIIPIGDIKCIDTISSLSGADPGLQRGGGGLDVC